MRLFGKRVEEPPERPRAQRPGELPADGAAVVGGVELPPGRRHGAFWRTDAAPSGIQAQWAALAARFADTGLWPVLLEKARFELEYEVDPDWEAQAAVDAEALIADVWRENLELDEELAEMIGPFPGIGRGGLRVDGAAADAIKGIQGIVGLRARARDAAGRRPLGDGLDGRRQQP